MIVSLRDEQFSSGVEYALSSMNDNTAFEAARENLLEAIEEGQSAVDLAFYQGILTMAPGQCFDGAGLSLTYES
jgi:hypothetical protein